MKDDIQSLAHSKWRCKYHIVFAPKYRRQIIYGKIKADVGKTYENWDTYSISYYADQWWACGLNKGVKINGEYYLKEIARGEGDSQIDALCSLVILKHDILEEESLTWMKEIFNG